jgi:hypothetical protein
MSNRHSQQELDLGGDDSQRPEDSIWATPEPEDFQSRPMQQYQTFVARDEANAGNLSNTLSFWDTLPKYGVALNQQESMRNERGDLPDYERAFQYGGRDYTLIVSAARLKGPDGLGYDVYPSEREQLVEAALRYLACQQARGFYTAHTNAPAPRAGVVFTIYQLRQLLAQRGRYYKDREIRDALRVMRNCSIRVRTARKRIAAEDEMSILDSCRRLSKDGDIESNDTRWRAVFNERVSAAIAHCDYRQFDYDQMVRCKSALARWLYLALSHRWRNASPANPMRLTLREVQRDSGFLRFSALGKSAGGLDKALAELVRVGVLGSYDRDEERGPRKVLCDITYTLHATRGFAQQVIDANMRQRKNPTSGISTDA